MQVAALAAALAGALLLTWTDKRWPEVQEAMIGVMFVLAANAAILLLASNPHGGEHLKDLLVGQILWVEPGAACRRRGRLRADPRGLVRLGASASGRIGFYVLFACAVTVSVQLVGVYLVFATLIVPALATRGFARWRLAACYGYAVGALGYAAGLGALARAGPAAGAADRVLHGAALGVDGSRRRCSS